MAKRKKKRQIERVLEPLVKPGEPLKTPTRLPVEASREEVRHASISAGQLVSFLLRPQ